MTSPDDIPRGFGRRKDGPRVTIEHGGSVRAFQIEGRTLAAGVAAIAVVAVGCLATAGWVFFHDDLLTGAMARQIQQARAYEDRVAALRAEVDRINGRQLLDQDAFEAKIDRLLERQSRLGETQARIGALVDKASEAGVRLTPAPAPKIGGLAPIESPLQPVAPAPSAGETGTPPPLDTERFATPLRSSWLAPFVAPARAATRPQDPVGRIAQVERSLDRFEGEQTRTLGGLADLAESRGKKIDKILLKLGFRVAEAAPRPRPRPSDAAVGGPYVPATPSDAAERADAALTRLALIRRAAAVLPLRAPIPGETTVTSGFGNRYDPFLGTPAMHTGIDFRAETGEAVEATGPGTVVASGRQGGYGIAVDIDHGNGIVTRYGHLSAALVTVGEKIRPGQTIGRAGSTGRSTGPHLHYETRVGGEAVDPTGWLEAGRDLGM